jgi:hypothetical protein
MYDSESDTVGRAAIIVLEFIEQIKLIENGDITECANRNRILREIKAVAEAFGVSPGAIFRRIQTEIAKSQCGTISQDDGTTSAVSFSESCFA